MKDASKNPQQANNILVIGGTGKTGRRVVDRLKTRNIKDRICKIAKRLSEYQ